MLTMYITYDELRSLKRSMPKGSVRFIADHFNLSELAVRNFFGGNRKDPSKIVSLHRQPGPNGGIYFTDQDQLIELAKKLGTYKA